MTENINLPINRIDYDGIQENFQTFLKNQDFYRDFNFEGSGVKSLLNILSYNAHFIGYYVKMMLNESFLDSAVLRESLLSKAKLNGYLPRGYRSSRSNIKVRITIPKLQDSPSKTVTLRRESFCVGSNSENDNRRYHVLDSVICYERHEIENDRVLYISPEIMVYEGKYETWKFKRDRDLMNQRYIIRDNNIDIDTIRVFVTPEDSSEVQEYRLASSVFNISPTSRVFYISTNEESSYEIFFGNDKFGMDVPHNSKIEVRYVSTEGDVGNGCRAMQFVSEGTDDTGRTYTVDLYDVTYGGSAPETIDELRFNIPNHYKRQYRLVTEDDYRSILLNEFRNIDSINVWGGEKHTQKSYNSVFICVKPKNATLISDSAKREMQSILEKYQVIGKRIYFVQPEYIYITLGVDLIIDMAKSSKSIATIRETIADRIENYNSTLSRFDSIFSNVELLSQLKAGMPEIYSIHSATRIKRKYVFNASSTSEHVISFGNKVTPGVVFSDVFTYNQKSCAITDNRARKLFVIDNSTGGSVLAEPIGTIDYDTGVMKLRLDFGLTTNETFGDFSILNFNTDPQLQDLFSYQNNILIIDSSVINISEK